MSRGRGRPSRADGPVVTREELLNLAARCIGRDGLARASMRGIAREAGVSLATVQHHFRTKEVLWKAVVDEVIISRQPHTPDPDGPASYFRRVVHERLGDAVAHPGLTGQVLVDSSKDSEVILAHLAERTLESREQNRLRLAAAMQAELLATVDVEAVMALVGIALPALSSSKRAIRSLIEVDIDDDQVRERLADGIADILLYGLLPRESSNEGDS